jgi:mitochondrial fission protein ELM1
MRQAMGAEPDIWILSRGRKGDLDQMVALCEAGGWRYELKRLSFAGPEIPVLSSLLLKNSGELSAPWPRAVMCAEASASVIAKGLKRKAGGAIGTICIGRPAGTPDAFDLVITTPQYRIPSAQNVVELSMPLTASSPGDVTSSYPRDEGHALTALIVGGPAFPDRLDGDAARTLITSVLGRIRTANGILAVHTSPRTPPDVIAVLAENIKAPHRLHVFGQGENLYRLLLAAADEIVVTSDSVSMVSDALASGKPVSIYPLPQVLNLKWQVGEWLYGNAVEQRAALLAPARWLFDAGIIESAADRRRLFAKLVAEKRASMFGSAPLPPQPDAFRRDLERAVESVRALIG